MTVTPTQPQTTAIYCNRFNCGKLLSTVKKCSQCRSVFYCGQECQKAVWESHKVVCKSLKTMSKNEIGEFTKRDLEILGCTEMQLQRLNELVWRGAFRKTGLSCFDFTLLEVEERGVRELFIFSDRRLSAKMEMDEKLTRWGYEVAVLPKEGDLVLYSNEDDLQHMGLYLGNGQVKSKLGNNFIYSVIHALTEDSICKTYGSQIVCYRKNPQIHGQFKEVNLSKVIAQYSRPTSSRREQADSQADEHPPLPSEGDRDSTPPSFLESKEFTQK